MNDPLIHRFGQACGATGALDLRVDLADGGVLAEGTVQQPFTLVGRDDACDVTLTDPEVDPRHAWLQVYGGRVFAVDLGSRAGLGWPHGETGSGWLDVGAPARIGPFRLHLRAAPGARVLSAASPLRPDPAIARTRPAVALEFRNGKRAKDRWTVNRGLTLVGRSEACKLHLIAEDIAAYHCGLVLTPTGLWVVDLSGCGVVVNGERMRVAPLNHGAELWVGRFLIGCSYPNAAARAGVPTPTVMTPPPAVRPRPAPPPVPEDEVPLGFPSAMDPGGGLPSSHIMADAVRFFGEPGATGPISSPILVSTAGAPSSHTPPGPADRAPAADPGRPTGPMTPAAPPDAMVLPLLRQLGEIHGQMFEQFQQSLLLVMRAFGQMHRDQMAAMQQELSRIQELNAELGRLQAEVARLAVSQALTRPAASWDELAAPTPDGRPLIGGRPAGRPAGPDAEPTVATAAIQDWVIERMNALQQERQSRWQKLVGYATGPTPPA